MPEIKTINGFSVAVDERDLALLSGYRLSASLGKRRGKIRPLAVQAWRTGCSYDVSLIHRMIMNPGAFQVVDHIDGDPLNNVRENLRVCTRGENTRNRKISFGNKCGFKGVFKRHGRPNHRKQWRAKIVLNGKAQHLGYYLTPEEAHSAYVIAAECLHGQFANPG